MEKELCICKCGRLHFIDSELRRKAIKDNKIIILICGNCGLMTVMGANVESHFAEGKCIAKIYDTFVYDFPDAYKEFDICDFKENNGKRTVYKIIYDDGIGVPMMTGDYANRYDGTLYDGTFYDEAALRLFEFGRMNITSQKALDFISKWKHNAMTVDMQRLIYELGDDNCKVLSRYSTDYLDWKGTKYEPKKKRLRVKVKS